MVKNCSVFGCTNCANQTAKERNISFFKFPAGKHKRRSWIKSINRNNWQPTVNSYVCSEHFVTGWHSDERDDIDYSPPVFRYKKETVDERRHGRVTRQDLSKVKD
ncbi:THAP domain-containing protein 1-like [Argopecten irradians]|uniref:THAP domain-containing protein 1-like n=1 Tax=Argopecten irradians TaxID=31199 RepID=UPI003722B835